MKLTALAVVILALGIILGFALAGGTSEGPALAAPQCPGPSSQCPTPTPSPPQQRQTEVTLVAGFGSSIGGGGKSSYQLTNSLVGVDTAEFPTGAVFTLSITGLESANNSHCLRLVEVISTSQFEPVAGSEVCTPVSSSDQYQELQSGPLTLPAGEHLYMLQWRVADPQLGDAFKPGVARIIVEWTE